VRMNLTKSNVTLISPTHLMVRKLLLAQFVDLVLRGAGGFQLGRTVLNGILDFHPRLRSSHDRSMAKEMLALFREVPAVCHKVNPSLALASEIFWERAFPLVDVFYVRMNDIDMGSPALRCTFPDCTSTICAESPGDFNVVNKGKRHGLVWAVQPRQYNDSMGQPLIRRLSRYVQELIRIRMKHKGVFFQWRCRADGHAVPPPFSPCSSRCVLPDLVFVIPHARWLERITPPT
jgi:hypothetical protein